MTIPESPSRGFEEKQQGAQGIHQAIRTDFLGRRYHKPQYEQGKLWKGLVSYGSEIDVRNDINQ